MTSSHFVASPVDENVLTQIKTILTEVFQDEGCTIYLFGSRATGAATATSDFDVAVLATQDISGKLSLAREKLDESNIPFKVELVDLRRLTWRSTKASCVIHQKYVEDQFRVTS